MTIIDTLRGEIQIEMLISVHLDSSKGYGGSYGVDQNVQDKSAVGFAHREEVPKHSSQKGTSPLSICSN